MTRVGRALALGLGSILVICSMQAAAQGDPRDALLKRLNAEFPPTKFKAGYSDIVTQGAVCDAAKGWLVFVSRDGADATDQHLQAGCRKVINWLWRRTEGVYGR